MKTNQSYNVAENIHYLPCYVAHVFRLNLKSCKKLRNVTVYHT